MSISKQLFDASSRGFAPIFDARFSGQLDFDDYSLIDLAFNMQAGTLRCAFNYLDGHDRSDAGMNTPELRVVQQHFEQFGHGYATSFLNAVPEPGAAMTIGALASTALAGRRRLGHARIP